MLARCPRTAGERSLGNAGRVGEMPERSLGDAGRVGEMPERSLGDAGRVGEMVMLGQCAQWSIHPRQIPKRG